LSVRRGKVTPISIKKRDLKAGEKIKGKKNPVLVAARREALKKMVIYLDQH